MRSFDTIGWTMTQHQRLNEWIEDLKTLCEPDHVVICDGSQDEYDRMMQSLVEAGVAKPLNPCLLYTSDAADE